MRNTVPGQHGWIAWLALLGGLAMAFCQWLIFFYAPEEQWGGLIQKIFYTHMPLAWWALLSFLLVFIGSIGFLRTRSPFWDALNGAAAEVGVLLSALALITGSIWARVAWNTWWTWDPRLSTTLIMWFIYAGYLMVRKLDLPRERRAVVSAVIGIVAFLDVPLVFFSTRLWPKSMHPTVFAQKGSGMEPEMKLTVIVCVFCLGFLWAALTAYRCRAAILEDKLETLAAERALRED